MLEGKDLETMRRACKLGREAFAAQRAAVLNTRSRRQVLDTAARFMRPGVTGDEIDRVVYQAQRTQTLGGRCFGDAGRRASIARSTLAHCAWAVISATLFVLCCS